MGAGAPLRGAPLSPRIMSASGLGVNWPETAAEERERNARVIFKMAELTSERKRERGDNLIYIAMGVER